MALDRAARLDKLRELRTEALQSVASDSVALTMNTGSAQPTTAVQVGGGGIDVNDPILSWDNFHQPVGVRDD